MSFFNKIFGGGQKKVQQKQPVQPKPPSSAEKKIQIESAMVTLDKNIKNFEDQEKKTQNKITILKAKAKQYLEADKKKQAKKYLEQATRLQKQLEAVSVRRKALENQKFQLEQTSMDKQTIEAMSTANEHMKDHQIYSEKLQNLILDQQDAKMRQQEITDKLKDLTGFDSENQEVDELEKQLMAEINKEKKAKIQENGKKIQVNVPEVQKQKKKVVRDQIEDMLNGF